MNIAQLLNAALGRGLTRLDAQRLLLHSLGRTPDDRAWLLSHDGDAVDAAAQARFDALCARHGANEPMGYLLGQQGFYGLDLQVDPRVLVPRPDTETLVDWGLQVWPAKAMPHVLDLGTGSGAIALALAAQRGPGAHIHASDQSADALVVAQGNAQRLGLPIQWHRGSWWQAVEGLRFDLVLSNPPYIADDDAHLHGLRHEPITALTSGPDGLDDIRAITSAAHRYLSDGAWLLLEHGHDQGPAVAALLENAGFNAIAHRQDLAGHVRCTGGQWKSASKRG